jgi:nucleotide-binding universal stress UspA family protein
MGQILLAYDGSETSKKALKKALALMKEEDELLVVMVVPTNIIAEFADVPPDVSIAKAQNIVNELISDLKAREINVIGMVREGDIADEILKIGSDMECDLIVIGDKGVSKIGRFAMGSVADKVVHYANRPVLIVK